MPIGERGDSNQIEAPKVEKMKKEKHSKRELESEGEEEEDSGGEGESAGVGGVRRRRRMSQEERYMLALIEGLSEGALLFYLLVGKYITQNCPEPPMKGMTEEK